MESIISAEDVMGKLKEDGDFDRLRLKIIRQLKDNEELRNSIIAVVRQSATLARPGAENMKPRQLSDAIHAEVGDKLMSQCSDSLWEIIRSPDGMKKEIVETVESVYNKLSNPVNEASPSINDIVPLPNQDESTKNRAETSNEVEYLSDCEPPGFSSSALNATYSTTLISKEPSKEAHESKDVTEPDTEEMGPPGFSIFEQPIDPADDDPVVPPGFG